MEPARTIIKLLGGEAKVSEVAGVSYTSPYRWQQPREKGGTDGIIPHWHVAKLLEYAASKGIALNAADFAPRVAPAADLARAS